MNGHLSAGRSCTDVTRGRITFEWALTRDVNDSEDEARRLARHLKRMLCHVNINPLTPTQQYPGHETTLQRALAFQAELQRGGIPCTIRLRRGIDIQAGCGQLASQS